MMISVTGTIAAVAISRRDRQFTGVLQALEDISEKADDVISDCRDRKALDCLLQPQTASACVCSWIAGVTILLLDFDVYSRAKDIRGPHQLVGKLRLPRIEHAHGAHWPASCAADRKRAIEASSIGFSSMALSLC